MHDTGRPIRWGVLSTANIGIKAVIPGIRSARNGVLHAIASRDSTRATEVARRWPGVRAYGSYEELLADPEVDAVYIPLPNGLHLEWTERAAEHGKHVLCEKPLAATEPEVRRMFDACNGAGVLLMEAFMYRFHPQIRWVREQIAAGAIGEVRFARGSFAFDIRGRPRDIRLRAALDGGSLMDVGCYPLSFCRVVFGHAPISVSARAYVPADGEVELTIGAILDFGEGKLGMVDSSFALPAQQHAEVVGDAGRIVIPRPYTPAHSDTCVLLVRGDETIEHRFTGIDQYRLEVEHFGDCIQNGTKPDITEADSLDQVRAIEAIYAAAGYQWPRR